MKEAKVARFDALQFWRYELFKCCLECCIHMIRSSTFSSFFRGQKSGMRLRTVCYKEWGETENRIDIVYEQIREKTPLSCKNSGGNFAARHTHRTRFFRTRRPLRLSFSLFGKIYR